MPSKLELTLSAIFLIAMALAGWMAGGAAWA